MSYTDHAWHGKWTYARLRLTMHHRCIQWACFLFCFINPPNPILWRHFYLLISIIAVIPAVIYKIIRHLFSQLWCLRLLSFPDQNWSSAGKCFSKTSVVHLVSWFSLQQVIRFWWGIYQAEVCTRDTKSSGSHLYLLLYYLWLHRDDPVFPWVLQTVDIDPKAWKLSALYICVSRNADPRGFK